MEEHAGAVTEAQLYTLHVLEAHGALKRVHHVLHQSFSELQCFMLRRQTVFEPACPLAERGLSESKHFTRPAAAVASVRHA